MTAPTKGHAVTLDRERRLRFPLSTLKEIEEDSSLGRVLWLGLKHEDDELTQEAVEDMIALDMLEEMTEPLRKATGGLIDLDQLLKRNGAAQEADDPEKKGPVEQKSGS